MNSPSPVAPLRLAILVADEPLPSVAAQLGGFAAIFTTLLRAAATAGSGPPPPPPLEAQLTLTAHDVVAGGDPPAAAYPDPEGLDAVLITGSRHAAYVDDAWVVRLVAYTRRLLEAGRVRVLGVCFGHQIAARALGAPVGRSPAGWELSVTEVELTAPGKRVFGVERLNIFQTHRDAVLEYPPGVVPLGHTEQCPTQGMYIPRRLLTVQGHPEFSRFMMHEMLQARHQAGVIPTGPFEDAVARLADEHDGVLVAQAFLRFLRE